MLCPFDIKTIHAIIKKNNMTERALKSLETLLFMLLVLVLFVHTLIFVVLMLHVVEVCVVEVFDDGGDFGGSDEGKIE